MDLPGPYHGLMMALWVIGGFGTWSWGFASVMSSSTSRGDKRAIVQLLKQDICWAPQRRSHFSHFMIESQKIPEVLEPIVTL